MGFHPWGVGVNLTNDFDFYDYKMLRFKNRLSVCLYIPSASTFSVFCVSAVFFFFSRTCWLFVREQCICALFMDPQITLFNNFFIKNGSHGTIHTFKNYFATVFSVFSFQFQQNKFYPNTPLVVNWRVKPAVLEQTQA